MASYLGRYFAGEHQAVWDELRHLGPEICDDNQLLDEAWEIACATMDRVAENIFVLIDRLERIGYRFGVYPDGSEMPWRDGPHTPPPNDIEVRIDRFEQAYGELPLSLRAFYEVVGSVNFIGAHPDLTEYSDPLVVDGLDLDFAADEFAAWEDASLMMDDEDVLQFPLPFAPDPLHKDNVSGGAPYAIGVPNAGIDGRVIDEPHHEWFVDYLRRCIEQAGFPGMPAGSECPAAFQRLASECVPF